MLEFNYRISVMYYMLYVSLLLPVLDENPKLFWMRINLFFSALLYQLFFLLIFFLAAVRDWLSAGGIKGEASRDGNFGHSPPTTGERESRGRQPSKNAH